MRTAASPSTVCRLTEEVVRALPRAQDSFLLDAPPGCRHSRNAPYGWTDGQILFGWRPCAVLRIDPKKPPADPLHELDVFLRAFEGSGAAIAVGYLSYDLGGYCEPAAASKQPVDPLPLVYFAAYDEYFALCGSSGRLVRRRRGKPDSDVPDPRDTLSGSAGAAPADEPAVPGRRITSDLRYAQYIAAVKAAKEYILSGDIYEVNLSQRFAAVCDGDMRNLYVGLRRCNPAPYSAYISTPDAAVLSCSPELFLRVDGSRVVTRPIKGTARRSVVPAEDDAIACALDLSEKDNAELAMIVDLERNDLGRVCRYGSVKVAQARRVETFARVHHLVSTIEGRLRAGVSLTGLLAATFPGGSITGAPKIRAMQIIDELEPCRRGVYTGSIGYVMPGGRAEFNIAIRTLVHHQRNLYIQVGGAITADSDPHAEYLETLAKAEAIFQALGCSVAPAERERPCQ